ncbi:hypothetical protein ONE63_008128 [Megalurothrips usitatus]|uniref:Uncharacterized protein n=1 Tax=Megalurothrips usitatus TaxID=439358 RepID=A0AAV7XK78_9NEOP|nr:hypothetical protein ONE63_008128 [Megalurothrips usitatus]
MFRHVVVAVLAVAFAGQVSGGIFSAGTVQNKFMVTYSIAPDPLHTFSFYSMPRTIDEAKKDHWAQTQVRDEDKTTVWCRKQDYRVCVLFDQQGSVAGIQLSVKYGQLDKASPVNPFTLPELRINSLLGNTVYSATTFFVSKDVLLAGGRPMTKDTLTAPGSLYILQTDDNGEETGRLEVSNIESNAPQAGFTEQACFYGMGKHYFQELSKTSKCEEHRPYFLLYGPKTKKLNGYGYTFYGKPNQGRGWFETPPALVAKQIAPNSPDCMSKFINKYGMFTMHVFFVDKPWYTTC